MTPIERDTFYTPPTIRRLLPYLALLADGRFPRSRDDRVWQHKPKLDGWSGETAVCTYADLTAALDRLSWFDRECVIRSLVRGYDLNRVARELDCDWETVSRHCGAAVTAMALSLGWSGRAAVERTASPTVWHREAA